MKVIFVEDVHNVAKAGEVKDVADGFARNYLIPKKLAVVATSAAMKNLESHRRAITNKQTKIEAQAGKLPEVVEKLTKYTGARNSGTHFQSERGVCASAPRLKMASPRVVNASPPIASSQMSPIAIEGN